MSTPQRRARARAPRADGRSLPALLLLASACEQPPLTDADCPAWTRVQDERCVLRAWSLPDTTDGQDAVSAPGARDLQVALSPQGDALIAWAQVAMNAEGFVVLAEPTGSAWTTIEVRAGEGSGLEPAVALGPDGHALLAWKQQRADGVVYLATRDADDRWHWPDVDAPLSWSETAYEPRVAFSPRGEALALWNQWTGRNFGVALALRSAADPRAAFVAPTEPAQLLSPAVNYANAPRLAVGDDGEALITWYQAPVDDLMVYVAERRERGGAFTRPAADELLSPPGGPVDSHAQGNPWPALHSSGTAAVAWTQQHGEGDFPVYLATREPDGTWHRPASLHASLSEPGAFARCPQVAFAPAHAAHDDDVPPTLVVTWFETRGSDTAVLAWRGHAGPLASSRSQPPLRLSTPGAEAVHPALAIGPDGGTVVVWAEREGEAWRVVARRHQPHSDTWLPAEPLSSPTLGLAPEPQLALAPDDGRVLVAWVQGGVLDGRVYVATAR